MEAQRELPARGLQRESVLEVTLVICKALHTGSRKLSLPLAHNFDRHWVWTVSFDCVSSCDAAAKRRFRPRDLCAKHGCTSPMPRRRDQNETRCLAPFPFWNGSFLELRGTAAAGPTALAQGPALTDEGVPKSLRGKGLRSSVGRRWLIFGGHYSLGHELPLR
jgi:hypothetical protein